MNAGIHREPINLTQADQKGQRELGSPLIQTHAAYSSGIAGLVAVAFQVYARFSIFKLAHLHRVLRERYWEYASVAH